MIEVVQLIWCDLHRIEVASPDQKKKAVVTRTIDLGDGPRQVDLCGSCDERIYAPMAKLLDSQGRAPNPEEEPVKKSGQRRKYPSQMPVPCPECGHTLTRTALARHIYVTHLGIAAPMSPTVCPECGADFGDNTVACGIHRTRNHSRTNYDDALEALEKSKKPVRKRRLHAE